ncbi:hypothetical protein CLUG_00804 [Clavispora lusitaniae ATCC 42720]|uniref:Inositol-pentakisphosphate 2-kinase n=1 Tax=Clavispora lusitaniae (strain ATCC 42720) TaxID=306902 RepID=C4XXY1_CLAL4|nr:uncharacterized protein CLUG_00804 [Clavispora lusitaniae ATCC 42720]EEQ36681.1 hypothetical protein CLUG_00804 [Clavispora lusitaniae ATCC 42720]
MDTTRLLADEWKYFAKGNANLLFKYVGPEESLRNYLLRLRMKKDAGTYIPTLSITEFIDTKCKALFPTEIISTKLVELDDTFLSSLDTNGYDLMPGEKYGLLLPNMLAQCNDHLTLSKHCSLHLREELGIVKSAVIELKPKWLYDNLDNYCRTCSILQSKGHERHFCTLDLLSTETVARGVKDLLGKLPDAIKASLKNSDFPIESLLIEYFGGSESILQKLKAKQDSLDDGTILANVKSESDVSDQLALRMTLRDVGVFVVIERGQCDGQVINIRDHGEFTVAARIYDLDLKPKARYKHWVSTELKLGDVYNSSNSDWPHCVKKTESQK